MVLVGAAASGAARNGQELTALRAKHFCVRHQVVAAWLRVLGCINPMCANVQLGEDVERAVMDIEHRIGAMFSDPERFQNDESVQLEERVGDSVAQQTAACGQLEHIFVTRSESGSKRHAVSGADQCLVSIRPMACEVNGKDGRNEGNAPGERVVIRRSDQLIDEFHANSFLLAGSFPHLFLLGPSTLPSDSVDSKLAANMPHCHDRRFARSHRLLFPLANQCQRRAASVELAARAKNAPGSIRVVEQVMKDRDALEARLHRAALHPNGPEATELRRSLLPHIVTPAANVPFNPLLRCRTISLSFRWAP